MALLSAQFACGALTLLLFLRVVYVLSANPIGAFAQELVYLRSTDLRRAAYLVLVVVMIEVLQMLYPLTVRQGWLRAYPDATILADTVQAALVLGAGLTIALVVRRYTHRALDRRIRESMETLAYLESQRRRRRQVESGNWTPPTDEE